MSRYAEPADFDRFGIRSDALPDSVTTADKQANIDAASTKADSYLRSHFTTPLQVWGDDLRQAVCAIAAFELVSTQVGFNPEAGHNMVLVTRKEDAIRWLEQISRGAVTPDGVTEAAGAPASVRMVSNPPRGW